VRSPWRKLRGWIEPRGSQQALDTTAGPTPATGSRTGRVRSVTGTAVPATKTLSEHASKQLLAAAGIPVADERLCETADDAVRAAVELGFPVAVKLCGDTIAHKTERGLVRLSLADED